MVFWEHIQNHLAKQNRPLKPARGQRAQNTSEPLQPTASSKYHITNRTTNHAHGPTSIPSPTTQHDPHNESPPVHSSPTPRFCGAGTLLQHHICPAPSILPHIPIHTASACAFLLHSRAHLARQPISGSGPHFLPSPPSPHSALAAQSSKSLPLPHSPIQLHNLVKASTALLAATRVSQDRS